MISKRELIATLKTSGRYQGTDETLVTELFFNLGLIKKTKSALNRDGILSAGDKEGKILQPHPAYKIYSSVLRDILSISIRLGLSERDRRQMGIETTGEGGGDGFNDH
jgi:P27 family predicted phage terminase small subunit